jgi:hypothetical protein
MPASDVSLAALLDDLRAQIVAARDRAETPRYVVLAPDAYDAVASVKGGDVARGMPMLVLGMEIVRAETPAAEPRVF